MIIKSEFPWKECSRTNAQHPPLHTHNFLNGIENPFYLNDTVQQQAKSKESVDNNKQININNTLQFEHVTARPSQNYNYIQTQIGMMGLSVVELAVSS